MRHKDAERRSSGEDRSRHWNYGVPSQGMLRVVGSHQKLDEKHGTDSLFKSLEGTNHDHMLFWGF